MNKSLIYTVLLVATLTNSNAYTLSQLSYLSIKSVMDMPNLKHNKIPEHLVQENGGKPILGEARIKLLQGFQLNSLNLSSPKIL